MNEPRLPSSQGPPSGQGRQRRFALLSTTRLLVPLAVALGLVGAAVAHALLGRLILGGGAAVIALLWGLARRRRPEVVVDESGYRVVEAGRERLSVRFAEVKQARAVPAEQAMYVDCGDAARNLLLPSRHGYGFRFQNQAELYALLARGLDGKIEIVEALIPKEAKK